MLHGWIPSCRYINSKIQVKPLHPPFSHGPNVPLTGTGHNVALCPMENAPGAAHPILAWETSRNLTPLRWLSLCHTWPKVQYGRGQTHRHVDKIPGGNQGPWEWWLCGGSDLPICAASPVQWKDSADTGVTVPGCSPDSKSKLKGFPEMCN